MHAPSWKRRFIVAVLLLMIPLTLAPRTSWPLGGGWRAVVLSDTFESGRGATRTMTFTAIPPPDGVSTVITLSITGAAWELATASEECDAVAGKVVCVLEPEAMRRTHVLRVTVRTTAGQALHWTMSAAASS